MRVYYNEIDTFAAAWLRELMKAKQIPDGEVDERSIVDVRADDLREFGHCHFFAGIGGWAYALRLAGWPDDREVWTGSCPCQPFSSAGAQAGGHDPRDLWPAWRVLIAKRRPQCVFGEQVEAAIGHGWLDRVCDDLEREGYAIGACGLPAASVGAFHIRQRLWFVADAGIERGRRWEVLAPSERRIELCNSGEISDEVGRVVDVADANARGQRINGSAPSDRRAARESHINERSANSLGDAAESRRQGREPEFQPSGQTERRLSTGPGHVSGVAIPDSAEREARIVQPFGATETRPERITSAGLPHVGPSNNFWSAADWIPCADGKARPIEPGTFPLAYGLPARVGRLRGYGNAIVPQVAAEFIGAYLDVAG